MSLEESIRTEIEQAVEERLAAFVDEAVAERLAELVDAKLRERLGEGAVILPLSLLSKDIPELKTAQDEVLRIVREQLAP